MEPTLSFSDTDDAESGFDAQAEVRLQHMLDTLHAHPAFQGGGSGIDGSWQNDLLEVKAASSAEAGIWQQNFTVQRKGSNGRFVEADISVRIAETGEQVTAYAVRRTEDGWTTEYPLGQSQTDPDNRMIRVWNSETPAKESLILFTLFHAQTNTVLAELQAGISRLARSNGDQPATA